MMARISPRSIVRYFSGEEGALSEMCFDGSEDELSMEGEDPYDPLYSPQAGTINILQTKETKKYCCSTNIQVFLHLWEAVLCRPPHLDQQKVKTATQKNSLKIIHTVKIHTEDRQEEEEVVEEVREPAWRE